MTTSARMDLVRSDTAARKALWDPDADLAQPGLAPERPLSGAGGEAAGPTRTSARGR